MEESIDAIEIWAQERLERVEDYIDEIELLSRESEETKKESNNKMEI